MRVTPSPSKQLPGLTTEPLFPGKMGLSAVINLTLIRLKKETQES